MSARECNKADFSNYNCDINEALEFVFRQHQDLFVEMPKFQLDATKNYLWIVTTLIAAQYLIVRDIPNLHSIIYQTSSKYAFDSFQVVSIVSSFGFLAGALFYILSFLYKEDKDMYPIKEPLQMIKVLYDCCSKGTPIKYKYELAKTLEHTMRHNLRSLEKNGIHLRRSAILASTGALVVFFTTVCLLVSIKQVQITLCVITYCFIVSCIGRTLKLQETIDDGQV